MPITSVTDLIKLKRDGLSLTPDQLKFLVEGFSRGTIPSYQISAWLMAAFLRGLDADETATLTRLMCESGVRLDWAARKHVERPLTDKHSSGGVGDKVSLILAPLASACGLDVPMMSGRGLDFTGGTVDKLLAIPGMKMELDQNEALEVLNKTGFVMLSQSEAICPADKTLYHLRDVTGTVESIPLITASIVSKKWAAGVKHIVFDVKCGTAAFMADRAQAQRLARSLLEQCKIAGIKARAVITHMDEPLGWAVGNLIEVMESMQIMRLTPASKLQERLSRPLKNLCVELVSEMLQLALGLNQKSAMALALTKLEDGSAGKAFMLMLEAQGAQPFNAEWFAPFSGGTEILSSVSGYMRHVDARELGKIGLELGVGRKAVTDQVDPMAGFALAAANGDRVERGQPLMRIYSKAPIAYMNERLNRVFEISQHPLPKKTAEEPPHEQVKSLIIEVLS